MAELGAVGTTVIAGEELLGVLPHKGKMLLISRVTEYNIHERSLRSEYDVTEQCVFFDPALGGVPAWMGFEFMAQAVSALSGITGKVMGRPPMMGFILSVSSLEVKTPVFRPGDVVASRVLEEMRVGLASTYRCTISVGDREAVTATVMVMDVENPAEFAA
jgi:predicted hotdog family 3-hydroxylacyl-ACP dehydratase